MHSPVRTAVDLPEGSGLGPELLRRGYFLRVAFRGGSMRPLLRPGDLLLVGPVRHPPRRGAVLLFEAGRALVVHRFLGCRGRAYRTKGDALDGPPETVHPARVIGRVVAYERAGRRAAIRGGPFHVLDPLAALASPWLPGLLRFLLPRGLRRAAAAAARRLWDRAARKGAAPPSVPGASAL